jgi:hypothetical protein
MQAPVAAVVLIALMAAACGGNDGEPAAEVTTAGAPETTTAAALEPVTVVLHEENRSGQSGTATLTEKGLSGTGVILEVSAPNRFPGDVQPAAIHGARCAEIRGRRGFGELSATEVQPLTEVRNGRSETTRQVPRRARRWRLLDHRAPAESALQGGCMRRHPEALRMQAVPYAVAIYQAAERGWTRDPGQRPLG